MTAFSKPYHLIPLHARRPSRRKKAVLTQVQHRRNMAWIEQLRVVRAGHAAAEAQCKAIESGNPWWWPTQPDGA